VGQNSLGFVIQMSGSHVNLMLCEFFPSMFENGLMYIFK
jgi:hypothetical protein